MTPDLSLIAAGYLLSALLLAVAAAGRRGVLLRLEREARAQEREQAAEVLACTLHDLHSTQAYAARLRAQRDEAYTCNDDLFAALMESRSREAMTALTALIVPAEPHLGFMNDEMVVDRNRRDVL